jgi:tocopherol cyclase
VFLVPSTKMTLIDVPVRHQQRHRVFLATIVTTLLLVLFVTTPRPVDSFVLLSSQIQTTPKSSSTTSAFLEIDPQSSKAYPQQPPHAGCHFRPIHPGTPANHKGTRRNKRFFEGWYYRITLEDGASFAFIYSIEDPFLMNDNDGSSSSKFSDLSLSCQQVMGPNDEYLVQADRDPAKFWAWYEQQGLGCVFDYKDDAKDETVTAMDPEEFNQRVKSGFQMLPTRLQGKLMGHDGSKGGVFEGQGVEGECTYDMEITPIAGWGDEELGQTSTAGWLASYEVFEPHWQVTMADGRATGSVNWKGQTYNFTNAPFYAEKNWGGSFPIKWYWCQCNSFEGYTGTGTGSSARTGSPSTNTLSVTAGGGTRKIPFGQTESLGMVSVHCNGKFYEATPWLGTMEWDISPWGYWRMTGRSTKGARPFEVELEAICDSTGVKLRAPTEKDGMVYFCRDSFLGNTRLSLWELEWDAATETYVRGAVVVDNATSTQAAVEVGGGPWWDNWKDVSVMKQPMKGLVRFPYRLSNLRQRLVSKLKRIKNKLSRY